MFRSLKRILTAAAVVAVLPVVAQAQNDCIVIGAGNCTVNLGTQVTIPKIAYINTPTSAFTFQISNAGWQDFLDSGSADTTVTTGVVVTVKANTAHSVALEAGTFGGSWVHGDMRWDTQAGACSYGQATQVLDATESLTGFSGGATSGETLNLCLGLVIPNNLASPKLGQGTFALPLTLRITAP